MKFAHTHFCAFAALALVFSTAHAANSDGNTMIRATAGPSEIVIKTEERLAGAIASLTWNGKEFIDSADHGRELQSALNLDCGSVLTNETFNPTEAGSVRDGDGQKSSSQLLEIHAQANELTATTKMAFWLTPDAKSGGHPAKNTTILSNHLLTKHVKIGYKGLPNVISYDVTFKVPADEHHTKAVFEALTAYMPEEFSRFLCFNPKSGTLEPLPPGTGEQRFPIVCSVSEGTHAMGIYVPPQPMPDTAGPSYGRFNFERQKVVKWNCVFRTSNANGLQAAAYSFRMFVIVGDLETVRKSLLALQTP